MIVRPKIADIPLEAALDHRPIWQERAHAAIRVGNKIKRLRSENRMLLKALMAILSQQGGSLRIPQALLAAQTYEDEMLHTVDDRTGDWFLTLKCRGFFKHAGPTV